MTVDPNALQLFERYRERLRAFFARRRLSTVDIEDALQEVHLRFVLRIEDGAEIAKPGPYLFRIARNVFVDYHRKRPPDPVDVDPDHLEAEEDCSGSRALERSVDSAKLHRAMATVLSEEEKALCMLFYRDRFSHKEIGRRMDLSPETVRAYLSRILAKLKQRMNPPDTPKE